MGEKDVEDMTDGVSQGSGWVEGGPGEASEEEKAFFRMFI